MDTKYYIEWHAKIGKWVVKYLGKIQAHFDTQAEALQWGRGSFPGHGHETERVQVRENSPRGVKPGEWR
jgi:hypothetical protein